MNKITPTPIPRPIPQGRKVIQLPAFTTAARQRDLLNQLFHLSGLSATEQRFVARWRAHGFKTVGDRRCFGHMVQIHLGVKL